MDSSAASAPPLSSPITSFPILAVSIIGILTTSVLLLSYYVFVIKCCHADVVARLSRPRARGRRRHDDAPGAAEQLGLEESAIRAIPTFRYRARSAIDGGRAGARSFHECAVCLTEFREDERIKLLPACLHVFHIDCIDTWLQGNANCPLCRSSIAAPSPNGHFVGLVDVHRVDDVTIQVVEAAGSGVAEAAAATSSTSPWKTGQSMQGQRKKMQYIGSKGDECIDVRKRDEKFRVQQPMRRSFSMNSSGDRELCMALQKILQQNSQSQDAGGECSSSSRLRRSFFSFGRTRSSNRAVLPLQIEL
ncbi:RING-H2 finger protein ATL16-like [Canna indica]|uniref:RING-type E3 ubiquitin transferase n=1 Tax=Canna indica TaxID=4628 RepID=A0AAQ3QR11_9LILI|nr:RING-H2 finger protein ATL16-like [Canna indica]